MAPADPAPGQLHDDYKKAGFKGHIGFGAHPALIIVDMVEAYLKPGSPLYLNQMAADVLASNQRLLAAAHAAKVPVIFTGVRYTPGGRDGGHFYRKVPALACFDEGNPLGAFSHALAPGPGDLVVIKQYASAFFGTSLAATLNAAGIDTCLITGVSTSGCIRATATDAVQYGFRPMVVREAVGDRNPQVHDANLFDLDAKYADVVGEAEGLNYLRTAR